VFVYSQASIASPLEIPYGTPLASANYLTDKALYPFFFRTTVRSFSMLHSLYCDPSSLAATRATFKTKPKR
jgi:hypothetical protein